MINVFVYGTLKPGEVNYQYYCKGKVQAQSQAYTRGKLYSLAVGYPAMTPGENKVHGALLTFDNFNILNSLDQLEDYQENRPAEFNEYYRILVPVYSPTDKLLGQAWCYLMSVEKIKQYNGIAIASGWWKSNERRKEQDNRK